MLPACGWLRAGLSQWTTVISWCAAGPRRRVGLPEVRGDAGWEDARQHPAGHVGAGNGRTYPGSTTPASPNREVAAGSCCRNAGHRARSLVPRGRTGGENAGRLGVAGTPDLPGARSPRASPLVPFPLPWTRGAASAAHGLLGVSPPVEMTEVLKSSGKVADRLMPPVPGWPHRFRSVPPSERASTGLPALISDTGLRSCAPWPCSFSRVPVPRAGARGPNRHRLASRCGSDRRRAP